MTTVVARAFCRVRFSKSGKTIYLGGLKLQSQRGGGIYATISTSIPAWSIGFLARKGMARIGTGPVAARCVLIPTLLTNIGGTFANAIPLRIHSLHNS